MKCTVISVYLLTFASLASSAPPPSLTGRWVVTEDFFGTPRYMRLQLAQQGTTLAGNLNGDKLEGTVSGSTIHFVARNEHKDTFEVQGTLKEGILTATMVAIDASKSGHPYTFTLTAKAAPPLQHRRLSATISRRPFSIDNSPQSTSLF